jgi:hypothetical protein
LQTDAKLSGTVALTAAPEGLQFALNGAAPADLFSLLPAAYTGAVEQIRAPPRKKCGGIFRFGFWLAPAT